MDPLESLRQTVDDASRYGDYPALKRVLLELDSDHNGRLSFAELTSPHFIEHHCPAIAKSQVGYRCDFPRTAHLGADYTMYSMLRSDIDFAVVDYMRDRTQHAKPGSIEIAMAGIGLKFFNNSLAKQKLPILDPAIVSDIVQYGEAHLGEFKATNRVSLPMPKLPLHKSFVY